MRTVALLSLLVAAPSLAAPMTVAVLYFDNNTALREYDVLQKGMADMLGVGDQAKKDGEPLARCAANDEQLERELDRLFDADGVKTVAATLARLEAKCAGKAPGIAAWGAAIRGDCASATGFLSKAADQDVSGVRSACE